MYKLGLLPLVIPAIKNASEVQEYKKILAPYSRKKIKKEIEFWALVAIVGKKNTRVKIIVRRIGDGKLHFWSIMKLGENLKTP